MAHDKEKVFAAKEKTKDPLPAETCEEPRSPDTRGSNVKERGGSLCEASLSKQPEDRSPKLSREIEALRQRVNELESSLNENARASDDLYLRLLHMERDRKS